MGTKRNAFLGLLTLLTFIGCGLMASAQTQTAAQQGPESLQASAPSEVDYSGFLALTGEIAAYREDRLVGLADFNTMKDAPGTILLDTRSAEAFAEGHIKGAVHLNFSDFTDEKLAKVIGAKDTRILIYCNNNFTDNIAPVMRKKVELALNVPTFINLYGYGYENIYELGDSVSINDPDVEWVTGS